MDSVAARSAVRPPPDDVLVAIAEYALAPLDSSPLALETARYCLLDSLACAFEALEHPACTRLLGPVVPGANLPGGARVPGTGYELDPVQAAFNIGTLIRWLDYNDTWLAAEWGHPSDNLGAILAVTDYRARMARKAGQAVPAMDEVLASMIKAHEIQGVLALENSFNELGLDHVLLVRIASTAVAGALLGCDRDQLISALSHAFLDGGALRAYRHAPNTSPRKSWAAGDAAARGVRLALIARTGELACPSALSAAEWGFYDVLFSGQVFQLPRPFGCYVMENILFKIAYPAEFHGQTAVEAALRLHPQVADRVQEIDRAVLETQAAGRRIIDKTGPLHNPADRDHCLQYMVAIALLYGRLQATDYEDAVAQRPEVDALRDRMDVRENPDFTLAYHDPAKRHIANAVQVFFQDGTRTDRVAIEAPLGHRERRDEGLPLLREKFCRSAGRRLGQAQADRLLAVCGDARALACMPVDEFVALTIH